MVPSGRSAMICTVQPFVPVTRTRTSSKAEILDGRLDDRRHAGGDAGFRDQTPVPLVRHRLPAAPALQAIKKSGPGGAHSRKQFSLQPELTGTLYSESGLTPDASEAVAGAVARREDPAPSDVRPA